MNRPTTAGKRSQSVAQKQRLNGLTMRNRNRAVEQHRRIQDVQAQNLLDDTNPEQLNQQGSIPAVSTSNQTHGEDASLQYIASGTTAPPPYEQHSNDSKKPPTTDPASGAFADQKEPISEAESKPSSFNALEKTKPEESGKPPADKKSKRPRWRTFMKRSGKQEQSKGQSDPGENAKSNNTSSSSTPLVSRESNFSKVQEAPLEVITSPEQESYFELQQEMSGMQMPSGDTESSKIDQGVSGDFASPKSNTAAIGLDESSTTIPSHEEYTSNNPYKQLRLEAQSRPSYMDQRSGSLDNFSRTRSYQVVQGVRQRSQSRDTATTSPPPGSEPLSRQSTGGNRLGSISFGLASGLRQTWHTTTLSNRPIKFKVNFENQSFTNKISSPAARALGIDDTTEEFAGFPITYLTLLYTVSDGLATEADTVLGDEAEFVVMDEHESRTPLLVLGAAFAHLARIAEEGQYVYWSPGAVPENVRNIERLRLYKRFELVSW